MATQQPDYSTDPSFGNLLDKHRQLSFKALMDMMESKLDDLTEFLLKPTPFDQSPGKQVPYSYPVWFGPLPLTTARRATLATNETAAGHELLATLATPATPFKPATFSGPMIVDQEFQFRCLSLSAYGFLNAGYKTNPGFTVPYLNAQGVGNLLDAVGPNPAAGPNGGAMPLDYFGGTFSTLSTPNPNAPNISFDVELWDGQRGRRLHEGKLPPEMWQGGRVAHRRTGSPIILPKGTIVEPRLYLNELRLGSVLDTTTAFNAASVKGWVCLLFKGIQEIQTPARLG